MEPSCVRQNLIPGTSKLFEDFLYNSSRISRFFPHSYLEAGKISEVAGCIRYPESRRSRLIEALTPQNLDSAAVKKLAQPGCVSVVTGQQVGLFSGPAYTIFKALTALKLAAQLDSEGTPAVAVFWLATEDHDLAEVDHAWVFDENASPSQVSITSTVVGGGPVGAITLNEIPLDELRSALGNLPFADEVVGRVGCAYRPGTTLGAAFLALLRDILKGLPIVFIDPLQPEIRELAAPLLSEAIERAPELVSAVRSRDEELTAAGYHTQVLVEDDSSLLFLLGDHKRSPIRFADGRFVTKELRFTTKELAAQAVHLSPNALLRPVMQDFLFPTVAYIGGPAEIAYMAQSEVLYEKLLGRMPVIYPRNGFTLLDARSTKLMERYRLTLPDLLDHQEQVKSLIASRLVPKDLAQCFEALEKSVEADLQRASASLAQFDPTLESAAKKSSAKILHQIRRLSAKTARETLRRDQRAARDADYLINLVYPHRHLQERLYSILPFLAKHGMDVPERLYEMTQLTCPDHMVRTL